MSQENFPNFENIIDGLEIRDKIIVFRKIVIFESNLWVEIIQKIFLNIQFLSKATNDSIMSYFVTLVPCYTGIILQISHWAHVTHVIWTR